MKKRFLTTLFAAPLIAAPVLGVCSCGNNDNQVYQELRESMINNFLEWCKHPHPTYYWGPLNKYLTEWAEKRGWEVHRDEYFKETAQAEWPNDIKDYYGNIWFDVPATKGYENYPLTILQTHMDMVIDGMTYEEAKTTPVKPVIDKEKDIITTEGQKTSLGADDGAGSCIALALLDSDKVAHGPLRMLITADEEDGMLGANVLDPTALKGAKYLMNIDGDHLGYIVNSSGGMRAFWYALNGTDTDKVTTVDASCTQIVSIKCTGLRGGHSAANIIGHANALKCVLEVIDKSNIITNDSTFQLISATTDSHVTNAIPAEVTIKFATSGEIYGTQTKINTAMEQVAQKWKDLCPGDKDLAITAEYGLIDTTAKALTSDFSKTFNRFMNWYDFGVLQWIPGKENKAPATSQNLGPLTIDCTKENIADVLLFGSSSRSCYEDKLEEMERLIITHSDSILGENHYSLYADNPPYQPVEVNPMRDAIEKGYEYAGVNWELIDEHGGLEISAFATQRPDLYLTSVGPQLADWHSKHETLFLSSVIPTLKAIAHTLTLLK